MYSCSFQKQESVSDLKSILCSNDFQVLDNYRKNVTDLLAMQCPICYASFPRTQMEPMFLCDHMCCAECTKNFYRTTIDEIQDTQSLNRLTCFHTPHEITDDQHMFFFIWLEAKVC